MEVQNDAARGKYKQVSLYDMMLVTTKVPQAEDGPTSNVEQLLLNKDKELRVALIYHLRKGLEIHFSMSYRGDRVVNIRDRQGGGYIIERREGYVKEESIVCGLINRIQKRYTTSEGNAAISRLYTTLPSSLKLKPKERKKKVKLTAIERGIRIHQLVYHKVECSRMDCYGDNTFFSNDETLGGVYKCKCMDILGGETWSLEETHTVDKFMEFIDYLNLIPVFSELFLWDPMKRIATRIDLLCINSEMRFVLVSLKTGLYGRPGNPGETNHHFRSPLGHIRDSIKHRHDLQLLTELLLLVDTYKVPVCDALTIYVSIEENPSIYVRYIGDFAKTSGLHLNNLLNVLASSIIEEI
jgi:hypothetical protein